MAGSDPDRVELESRSESGEIAADVKIIHVTGFVKWFDVARGYGFIIPDNGMPDVLLHLSCLKA